MFASGSKDFSKAPDAAAKAPFVQNDRGLAPWQKELQKRKATGAATPKWQGEKSAEEENENMIIDDDEDAAALFFTGGTNKPQSPSTKTGASWQKELQTRKAAGAATPKWQGKKSAEEENENMIIDDDEDAAALFFTGATNKPQAPSTKTGETSFNSVDSHDDNDDAAALFYKPAATNKPQSPSTQTGGTSFNSVDSHDDNDDSAALFYKLAATNKPQSPSTKTGGTSFNYVDSHDDNDDAAALFYTPAAPDSQSDSESDPSFGGEKQTTVESTAPGDDAAKLVHAAASSIDSDSAESSKSSSASDSDSTESSKSSSASDSDSAKSSASERNEIELVSSSPLEAELAQASSSGSETTESSSEDGEKQVALNIPEETLSDTGDSAESSASERNEIELDSSNPLEAEFAQASSSASETTESSSENGEKQVSFSLNVLAETLLDTGDLEGRGSEYVTYEHSEVFEEASYQDGAEAEEFEFIEVSEDDEEVEEEVLEEVLIAEEGDPVENEEEELIIKTDDSATSDQIVEEPEEQAGTSPQHAILAELEIVESQMREYINSVTHPTSERSIPSQPSSVPWVMPYDEDRDSLASYASYVRSTIAEKPSFDQNSYIQPRFDQSSYMPAGVLDPGDMEVARSVTYSSSEQSSSIPWMIPYRELDSWANPVRELKATKTQEKATKEKDYEHQSTADQSRTMPASMSKRSQEDPPQLKPLNTMPSSKKKRPRKELPDSDASISMQVYRTSVPDPSRDTELWYHPGFSYLAQDSKTRARAASDGSKKSPNESLNGSTETAQAIVSDAEVVTYVYNTSIPKYSRTTRLPEPKKGAISESYASEKSKYPSPKDHSSRAASIPNSDDADSRWKYINFPCSIRRNSFPWVPDDEADDLSQVLNYESAAVSSAHSHTSSESSSSASNQTGKYKDTFDRRDVQKASPPRKEQKKATPTNVVRSKAGRITIALDPETFTYIPDQEESSRSLRSIREGGVTRASTCWEKMGYVFLCLCLILVPSGIAVTLILTKDDIDTSSTNVESNATLLPRSPTMAPTTLVPTSSSPVPIPTKIPTTMPATVPTEMPTAPDPPPEDLLFRLLASFSADDGESLRDRSTPQFAAMQWLRTPEGNQGVYNDEIFLQRYVLATLYFATQGHGWNFNDMWLTNANECEWFSSGNQWPCDSDGMVVELNLENNGLQGSIPKEIDLLFQLGKRFLTS
jgi:hypothetical protein